MKKRVKIVLGYLAILVGFGSYILLDAFVIPRDIVPVEEVQTRYSSQEIKKEETYDSGGSALADEAEEKTEPTVSQNLYDDGSLRVEIETIRRYDTTIYLADVTLTSADQLKAGLAGQAFGRNLTAPTSQIAQESGAVFAINGDYYGFRDAGTVLRNGYLYRDSVLSESTWDLVIDRNGDFQLIREGDYPDGFSREEAWQIFSFGPTLVQDGTVAVREGEEVGQAMQSNPRTAIGQLGELHYLFVVSDGRSQESEGLSLYQLAQIMEEYGCINAYNLDGGGSSTMWFMGEVVNQPTSGHRSGERSVSDIIYVQ